MTNIIAHQPFLRPTLPDIYGCKDYRQQRDLIERIDEIIENGNTDLLFQKLCLTQFDKWEELEKLKKIHGEDGEEFKITPEFAAVADWEPPYNPYSPSGNLKQSWLNHTRTSFRTVIIRYLTDESLRGMSIKLADSVLARWFCFVNEFGPVKPPSKSTIDRYEDWVDESAIRDVITNIIHQAAGEAESSKETPNGEPVPNPFDLENPVDLTEAWWDGTCLKANIHYPVDWILLRDICRTLMLAVILIRKRGLKNRMPEEPDHFMREMNNLVIAMTQNRRKKGSKKLRKQVLRKMVALEKRIAIHAERHAEVLELRWRETDLSEAQAQQIIDRIKHVLEQLPAAIEQARERIIGERQVRSDKKLLSIYESDINVIVRGKSDAEVEFGNTLRLAEQKDGIIIDFKLYKEGVSDNSAEPFKEGIARLIEITRGKIDALWTDRGFESKQNVAVLEVAGIKNGICPKSVEQLEEKMSDPEYAEGQRRRSSTEGRIGIFTNRILGGLLKSKGFTNRKQSISWAVLAHNLWVIARLPKDGEAEAESDEMLAAVA